MVGRREGRRANHHSERKPPSYGNMQWSVVDPQIPD